MAERTVTIINKLGLHARAAAKLVAQATKFKCAIHLAKAHTEVNAKSILGVMMLAAAKGTELKIIAQGEDAEEALDALQALVERRFDEEE